MKVFFPLQSFAVFSDRQIVWFLFLLMGFTFGRLTAGS